MPSLVKETKDLNNYEQVNSCTKRSSVATKLKSLVWVQKIVFIVFLMTL